MTYRIAVGIAITEDTAAATLSAAITTSIVSMEFLDEDARPRVVFQSRPVVPSSPSDPQGEQSKPYNKLFLAVTITISSLLIGLSIYFIANEPYQSLAIWLSVSLLIGPLAPSHITGGDIRVGQGPVLEPLDPEPEIVSEKRAPKRRLKPVRSEEAILNQTPTTNGSSRRQEDKKSVSSASSNGDAKESEEKEWSEEDYAILKKQMAKNPVGKPKRWEVIADAFNGRHKVDSVIKAAKNMGDKRSDDGDSYAKFLKNRKPVDTRVDEAAAEVDSEGTAASAAATWSSVEDIALLNAMKVFPKEVAMRWEKIAAAVPGKSKAACMKRVSDLKKGFRSSKAGGASN
ncbi:Transcription factor MAMYB [Linum grandiflorum]